MIFFGRIEESTSESENNSDLIFIFFMWLECSSTEENYIDHG